MCILSNSIFSKFIEYPFQLPVPNLIGEYLLGNEKSHANTGMVASGYAHFGFLGVTIYSILLGFILKIINYFSRKNIPFWLIFSMSIIPLRTLIVSSDLLVVLFTHGLILTILVLYLIAMPIKKITTT
jgi:hypothetical protein